MFIQSICWDYSGGINCVEESEHSKVYVVQEKGGEGVVQHEPLPKDHEIRLPRRASSTAPLHHHTRHDHDHRHKYDNHTLPNETHSLQNDLNVACLRELSQQSIASNTDRRIHIE